MKQILLIVALMYPSLCFGQESISVSNSISPRSEFPATTNISSLQETPLSQTNTFITHSQSTNDSYIHMVGIHAGMSSGMGLCYRNYVGKKFAWQIAFLPYYMGGNQTGEGFVVIGIFSQWFLHDFSHPFLSLSTRFFMWGGVGGKYSFGASSGYMVGCGGGIGLETYVIKNIVITLAMGYYLNHEPAYTYVNAYIPSFELSLGYRF